MADIAATSAAYVRARSLWLAADRHCNSDGPEWDALIAAETALFRAPCESTEDVQAKVKAFIEDEQLFDALVSDWSGPEHRAKQFLRSLLVERVVEPTEPLQALIAAHQAAWVALDVACEAADKAFRTHGQAAAETVQAKASDATADAMDAIVEHPYSSLDELKIGMAYIVNHHRSTGDGDLEAWQSDLVCNVAGVDAEAGGAA